MWHGVTKLLPELRVFKLDVQMQSQITSQFIAKVFTAFNVTICDDNETIPLFTKRFALSDSKFKLAPMGFQKVFCQEDDRAS